VAEQARAAGATGLVLHVFTANTAAVTLYRKLGFSDIGKEMFLSW
ncbi:GNAT family N-acetyltransferase, partial [Acidithiobacillus ferrooxidans]|nr:GNAT family N-acetyltransferase [Acidithiobacillus ferrooxidans]